MRSSPAHGGPGVGAGGGRAEHTNSMMNQNSPPILQRVPPVHTCAFPATLLVLDARPRQFAFEVVLPEFCEPDVPPVVFQGPGSEVLVEAWGWYEKKKIERH